MDIDRTALHPELLRLHDMCFEEVERHNRALEDILGDLDDGQGGADGRADGGLNASSGSLRLGDGGPNDVACGKSPSPNKSTRTPRGGKGVSFDEEGGDEECGKGRFSLEAVYLRAALSLLEDKRTSREAQSSGPTAPIMSGLLEKSKGEFKGDHMDVVGRGRKAGSIQSAKFSVKSAAVFPGRLIYFKSEGDMAKALRQQDDTGANGIASYAKSHINNVIVLDPDTCVCRPVQDQSKPGPGSSSSGRNHGKAGNSGKGGAAKSGAAPRGYAFELGNIDVPGSRRLWMCKSEGDREEWIRAILAAMTIVYDPCREPACIPAQVADRMRAKMQASVTRDA